MKKVTLSEIHAKTILRKHKKIDSWFLSHYGMNLYSGCFHNCMYCDGRSEGYHVDGLFGEEIAVKINAIDVLRRELNPVRKRTPLKRSFMMIGGGVGDSYQPVEKKYRLTQNVLQLMHDYRYPVHILTKSTLVERDSDILKDINEQTRAIVSFSFSSVDDQLSSIVEPSVPLPSERLQTIARLKEKGITCGMFLLPVIPFISDTTQKIDETLRQGKKAGIDFVVFGGMTLKEGRQKEYFFTFLKKYRPELIQKYSTIYQGDKWGQATQSYYATINTIFSEAAKKYRIPRRIPPVLYQDIVDETDLVIVILEHIDYLLRLDGRKSPYGFAAYSISQLNKPLSELKGKLRTMKGIGAMTEKMIKEILETGRSSYYEQLLYQHDSPALHNKH